MKTLLLVVILVCLSSLSVAKGKSSSAHRSSSGSAVVHVRSYTKKNGTVVGPSVRSHPNGTQRDNFSTKSNTNPVTGKPGTKTPKH
jgi:hypothetical protein